MSNNAQKPKRDSGAMEVICYYGGLLIAGVGLAVWMTVTPWGVVGVIVGAGLVVDAVRT